MLIRAPPKFILIVCPLLLLGWFVSNHEGSEEDAGVLGQGLTKEDTTSAGDNETWASRSMGTFHPPIPPRPLVEVGEDGKPLVNQSIYNELRSLSTPNGEFIRIHFDGVPAYNPNIIPHPRKYDQWIIVAQKEQSHEPGDHIITELTCNAGFVNNVLTCTQKPAPLPLKVHEPHCEGDMAYFNFALGARDARVVHGPDAPYILYGSHSEKTCLSVWAQDLRMLMKDYFIESLTATLFSQPAELQRPPPFNQLEKNFFLFWDFENQLHVHHDIFPKRVFAQLEIDGSVSPDLAPEAARNDEVCIASFMPVLMAEHESIHQATNSLSITLCNRSDPACKPSPENTYIMHIFHFKSFYDFHGVYEPYVVLFQRQAPFAMHGIATKPIWIHGRDVFTEKTGSALWEGKALPSKHSEMFYVTSMSWKAHGQTYHGYLDDVLFVAFGIEDSKPGVIDILAGDLLKDMSFCSDVKPEGTGI